MIKKIKDKNNPLANSMNIYLAHLQFERRLSENTISAYRNDLKRYINYLFRENNIKSPSIIEYRDIEIYIESIVIKAKELKVNTLFKPISLKKKPRYFGAFSFK